MHGKVHVTIHACTNDYCRCTKCEVHNRRQNVDVDIQDVDMSKILSQHPIDPSAERFEERLVEDVNMLVKVANTHRHSFTCYKYRKSHECRFVFLHVIYPETDIHLRSTSATINNFNPIAMTCIRSNHDIKSIPSGKDIESFVFYMADYATKSTDYLPIRCSCCCLKEDRSIL